MAAALPQIVILFSPDGDITNVVYAENLDAHIKRAAKLEIIDCDEIDKMHFGAQLRQIEVESAKYPSEFAISFDQESKEWSVDRLCFSDKAPLSSTRRKALNHLDRIEGDANTKKWRFANRKDMVKFLLADLV